MKFATVPRNEEAAHRLNYNTSWDGDLIEWELSEEEFQSLEKSGVFDRLNENLGTSIEEFEDCIVPLGKLSKALEILDTFENSEEVAQLRALFTAASTWRTYVHFFL